MSDSAEPVHIGNLEDAFTFSYDYDKEGVDYKVDVIYFYTKYGFVCFSIGSDKSKDVDYEKDFNKVLESITTNNPYEPLSQDNTKKTPSSSVETDK